jgi:hypothetical protein
MTMNTLAEILETTTDFLTGIFERMGWAEEEIQRAQKRHPHKSDELWHSFLLLKSDNDYMANETLCRSHMREILERVALGGDTRKMTKAEALIGFHLASLATPLTTTAHGAYRTLWGMVGMPDIGEDDLKHYRAIAGDSIDKAIGEVLARTADGERILGTPDCCGMHNGETVDCKFYAAS